MPAEIANLESIEPTGDKAIDCQRTTINQRALKAISMAGDVAEFGTIVAGGTVKLGIKATRGLIRGLAS